MKKSSKIAEYIMRDYNKEKQWKEKLEKKKEKMMILGEHSREPLIIEERGKM